MLLAFFERLREFKVPVSTREMLDCLNLFEHRLLRFNTDDFYYLSRTTLVKDEKYYDRFDLAFESFFSGLDHVSGVLETPKLESTFRQWLSESGFSVSEVDQIYLKYHEALQSAVEQGGVMASEDSGASEGLPAENNLELNDGNEEAAAFGSDDACYEAFADAGEAIAKSEQGEAGQEVGEKEEPGEKGESGESGQDGEVGDEGEEGESGKIGKGNDGLEGEGQSDIGEVGEKTDFEREPSRRAQKLWQLRRFEDYDADVELGTRNLKMALRRIRKFARTGAELELDLADTIRCTARNAGLLDIKEVPEKHNSIKVLLFLDIGGSMDDHIELCAQLFSAARYEFKHLEHYYFHNFIYETVWPDNDRRAEDKLNTWDVIHKFGSDYKIIFVGDANMARHEIAERGGSVEHFNGEPGEVWMQRVQDHFRKVVWLNPVAEHRWQDSYSAVMIRRLLNDHMYPLSVEGIDQAARFLVR